MYQDYLNCPWSLSVRLQGSYFLPLIYIYTDGQTGSRFRDLDRRDLGFRTSTDGHMGSRFQDLNRRTIGIWVSRPRQMDRRDLGFKTSTDRRTVGLNAELCHNRGGCRAVPVRPSVTDPARHPHDGPDRLKSESAGPGPVGLNDELRHRQT
jgi:hypothetical protein